jgi:hypothetical protein
MYFTLPPLGEGARRAEEGLVAHDVVKTSNSKSVASPSSVAFRATFPQRGKGDYFTLILFKTA